MNQSSSNKNERYDLFVKVIVDDTHHVFGFAPRPFQRKVARHLIKMKHTHCSSTLLAHGTCGGK